MIHTAESYINYISRYPTAKFPQIGKIYTFAYLFNQTINQTKSYNQLKDEGEIKFYDFMPCVFIWRIRLATYSFDGLNLNTIPVGARRSWLKELVDNAGGETPDPKKFLVLKNLFEKGKLREKPFVMHQYNMRKVRKLKEIPSSNWFDLMQFDVNTFFKATSQENIARYLSLIK